MNRFVASLATAAVFALSVPAIADDPPSPSQPSDPRATPPPRRLTWQEKQRRDALRREAEALVEKEQWQAAVEKLHEVIAIEPSPEASLWMGFAHEKLGKLLSAKAHYSRAESDAVTLKQPTSLDGARSALDALRKNIPRIKVLVPQEIGATVYVDEAQVTVPKEGVEVDPGSRSVAVLAPNRKAYRIAVTMQIGDVQTVEARLSDLEPIRPPAVVTPGLAKTKVSSGPPGGAIALGIVGSIASVAGAFVLGIELTSKSPQANTGRLAAGVTLLAGGLGAGVGGIVWGFVSTKEPRARALLRPGLTGVALIPTHRGAWAGLSGQL